MSFQQEVFDEVVNFMENPSLGEFTLQYDDLSLHFNLELSVLRLAQITEEISPLGMAINISVAFSNLFENSQTFDLMRFSSPITDVYISIMVRPSTVASIGESSLFDDETAGKVRLNLGWLDMEYPSVEGQSAFTLQHILNHEMVHVFTGLEDGPEHIAQTNAVNLETDAGPAATHYDPQDFTPVDNPLFFHCFAAGTQITMWPVDPSLKPGPDGIYDQNAVRAGIWTKPIEQLKDTDTVVAFDTQGNLVPGTVDKTFINTTPEWIMLDVADGRERIHVTPGHRFLTETGDYMEIGHLLRLGGGTARLVDVDGSIDHIRGFKAQKYSTLANGESHDVR